MEKNSIETGRVKMICPERGILKADPSRENKRLVSETELMTTNNRDFKKALSQELLGIGLSKKAVTRILTFQQVE